MIINLKEFRIENNLTAKKCAELSGVNIRTWFRWEKKGHMPDHRENFFITKLHKEIK